MISITKVTDIIDLLSESVDEEKILKYENMLVAKFATISIILASLLTFLARYYLLNESLNEVAGDSIFLLVIAIIFEVSLRAIKNEPLKMYLFSGLFSMLLIFIVIRFYQYIGPAVWTVSIILVMVSLVYTRRNMLLAMAGTIFLLGLYIGDKTNNFNNWSMYYMAQMVGFTILFFVVAGVHKIIVDRSKKVFNQYQDIARSEEKLNLALKSVGDGIITVDRDGNVDYINPIAEKLTGWRQKDAYGQVFENVFYIINEYTRKLAESPVKLVFQKGHTIEHTDHTILISKDGSEKAIENTAAPIVDKQGNISGAVLVFRDFMSKKEKRDKIEYLNNHDQLTGLYNRRFLEEELKQLDSQGKWPLTIEFGDVKGMKINNSAFDENNANQIIQKFGEILKSVFRAEDIIARLKEDEFVVLLPKTDAVRANVMVNRIKEKIESEKITGVNLSISFGLKTKDLEFQPSWEVLKTAEDIMYLRKLFDGTSKENGDIKSILDKLKLKSPSEDAHSKRVSIICQAIGKAYHLSEEEIKELQLIGEFHDIGKIAVDKVILNKEKELSKEELDQIREHPTIGYQLLSTSDEFYNIAEYVLAHHERWDGTGYPKGLKGEAIPKKARIVAIADSYDTMVTDRPYRKALSKKVAIAEIKKNAGTQFDPNIAKFFVETILKQEW